MQLRRLALTTLVCLSILAPSVASAGDILRQTPASDFTWKTTTCRKPVQRMSSSLSKDQRLESYSRDITAYIACLQREAQSDFELAQREMQTAIEKELKAETDRMDEMIKRAYLTAR